MKYLFIFFPICCILIGSMACDKVEEIQGKKLYTKNCTDACHSNVVEDFIVKKWQSGKSWLEVKASIKDKHQDIEKASHLKQLADADIEKITDYILTSIEKQTGSSFEENTDFTGILKSKELDFKLETVFSGIDIPWGFDFLPDGALLVTDKEGQLYLSKNNSKQKIENLPEIKLEGQGGLLDVAVHPSFDKNQTIYLTYSKPNDKDLFTTAFMSARLVKGKLIEHKLIMEAFPYSDKKYHFGSRIAIDDKGFVFVTVGDRGNRDENPQSLKSHCGKIHRFKLDGTIPEDNPFVNTPDAVSSIWSYGHRNPQGLEFDSKEGILWESEHAPRGGDEVNIIQKGGNYGWPKVSYGINYNGSRFTDKLKQKGFIDPVHYYIPSPALSGLTKVISDKYPAWEGSLLLGSLRFNYLSKLNIQGNQVQEERLLENIGRLRAVETSPAGYIYIAVENPGKIYKLVPVKK